MIAKHRRHHHQHDVERQDVEIAELMGEQRQADMGRDRIVEHRRRVVPFEQQRIVEQQSRTPASIAIAIMVIRICAA